MAYITSRDYPLPEVGSELSSRIFFNLWQKRLWPYGELLEGDTLYFYESQARPKKLVWKTRVADVLRFDYIDRQSTKARLLGWHDGYESNWGYLDKKDGSPRYCLAYTVEPLEKLDIPKPQSIRFPQQGWLRVDADVAKQWPGVSLTAENNSLVLDDIGGKGSLSELLQRLSDKLAGVAPERIASIVTRTIRRDTQMVKALKAACDWRCQFPGCCARIPTRSGGWYIEVAHIKPVSAGGLSVLGNLLVLCPNHHKEFDLGSLSVDQQTVARLEGVLNGVGFSIATCG